MTDAADSPPSNDDGPFARGFYRIFEILLEGMDRGAAILHQAALEEVLRRSLERVLFATGKHSKQLIGDLESAGKLGFSDQCRLAYCIGLVGEQTLSDLLTIAKIRNRFAHTGEALLFEENQSIKDRCLSLATPLLLRSLITAELRQKHGLARVETSPRARYIAATALIAILLEGEAERKANELTGPSRLP